jgi:RNA-directed DNA polymerase
MSGDVHVRFCERLGVQLPRATHIEGNFQYGRDAARFQQDLADRFRKFGLELAEEKTRVMRFGRFGRMDLAKTGDKPDTFDFLGFKHVCGTDRGGKFALIRIPCDKSRRKFLAKTKEWLKQHMHWKRQDQQKQLTMMLRGFYQYFGLYHCKPKLDGIRREVERQWARRLRRRSQRHRLYWCYLKSQPWFQLPYAVSTLHRTV